MASFEVVNLPGEKLVLISCILLMMLLPSQSRAARNDSVPDGDFKKEGELILEAACSDYPSCLSGLKMNKKAVSAEAMEEACRHATASFQCQRSATKMCEKERVVNADALIKMKRAYIFTEIYKQEMCHSGSSVDSVVAKGGSLCSEFRSCFVELKRYKKAADDGLYYEGCSMATYMYQCSTSALIDCKTRGTLSAETLDLMEDSVIKAGFRVDNICSYTTTTVAPTPPEHRYKCIDFSSCSKPNLDILQMAKRTGDFDEACRISTPYALCLEQSIEDCQNEKLVTGIALKSMQESLEKARSNVKTYCPFYEMDIVRGHMLLSVLNSDPGSVATFDIRTTASPVRCFDIGSCPRLAKTAPEAQRDYQKACESMKAHVRCVGQATQDCEVRNLVTGQALDSMVKAVEEGRKQQNYFCGMVHRENGGDDRPTNRGFTAASPSRHSYVIVALVSGWLGVTALDKTLHFRW